ncbi:hypothetical protein [Phycicoccus avicenniae]|uniref:hypothetical protein n=1 Tax=Phycicoccus avicenniae TaxID=2828860 RepID=UPI003D2793AB
MGRTTTRAFVAVVGGLAVLGSAAGLPAASAETAVVVDRQYTYQALGTLGGTGGWSEPAASNGAGTVVGTSNGHAYRFRAGVLTDLGDGLPGPGGESSARGVNLSGVVVGQSHVDGVNPPHAVRWTNGVMTDLGTGYGSGSGSAARGINDDGTVVGVRYASQSSPTRAVVWRGGRIIDLGSLGGTTTSPWSTLSEAHAVNNAGQVVGAALPKEGYPLHGFIWANGVMRDLGGLGGTVEATVALGINGIGSVVGFSQAKNGETHGFLWTNGAMRDLGVLGPDFTYRSSQAAGINDAGVVVGSARVSGAAYGYSVGTVWRNGVLTDLNSVVNVPSGRRIRHAMDVDNKGVIVALSCEIRYCEDSGHTDRTVILRPVG